MSAVPIPVPDLTVDRAGLSCVTFLLRLAACMNDAQPGTVVHLIATGPASHWIRTPGAT